MRNEFPEFNAPPVVEVVCGVTFLPLSRLLLPRFGEFWTRIQDELPTCAEHPPLNVTVERLGTEPLAIPLQVDVVELPRVWFQSRDGREILQLQRDRIIFNWKKAKDEDVYPRFIYVYKRFCELQRKLAAYILEKELGEFSPIQFELIYVNLIPLNPIDGVLRNVTDFVPDLTWQERQGRYLPAPDGFQGKASFTMPEKQGRLHITTTRAIKVSTGDPLLRLELLARGFEQGENGQDRWFDVAHSWIINGFVDVTTDRVQRECWGRNA